MMHALLTLPVLIPMLAGFILFFLGQNRLLLKITTWSASVINLLVAGALLTQVLSGGIQSVAFGNWPAPYGIVFIADTFSAVMVVISCFIGLCISLYAAANLEEKPSFRLYLCFIMILLSGINGAFLTGDLFNLYVWFEIMLISSFGLMILDADKNQIEGAIQYVVLNLISTLGLLLGIGLLYGATGSLNFADLHIKASKLSPEVMMLLSSPFLFAFGIKSALFPLFAWLPASYHTMPSGVVGLFAALNTKVGVYALMRFFTIVFPLDQSGWQSVLLVIAALTMLTGVLGATIQYSIKRILSFHIISQIGYMIMGLAIFTPQALAGAIFYLIHHIIVKANLFLIGGILKQRHGSDNLEDLGGAYKAYPGLAFLFLIPAFSLAGFPPLSGFWGKFIVIKAAILEGHLWLAITALFVGLLTIYSMTKIWAEAFWKKAPQTQINNAMTNPDKILYFTPVIAMAIMTIIIGVFAEPFYKISELAAFELLNPQVYVNTILGGAQE